MSTILNTNGAELEIPRLESPETFKAVVITAEWNSKITHALRDGALDVFQRAGVQMDNVVTVSVPGTVELVNMAARCLNGKEYSAIIIIGVVIRGDTPHFDYVCEIAANGTAILNAKGEAPVIFGVLTVDNEQQALDRAGGILGNKGAEAALAAIQMRIS